jgi:hypothetical protein
MVLSGLIGLWLRVFAVKTTGSVPFYRIKWFQYNEWQIDERVDTEGFEVYSDEDLFDLGYKIRPAIPSPF